MKILRRRHLVPALFALVSLLFMQLALAGYGCPATLAGQSGEAAEVVNMPDCQGMDLEQPNLCHAHAQAGDYSLDKPNFPYVQAFLPTALTLVLLEGTVADERAATSPTLASLLTRATAPPLAIRNCCFRT